MCLHIAIASFNRSTNTLTLSKNEAKKQNKYKKY